MSNLATMAYLTKMAAQGVDADDMALLPKGRGKARLAVDNAKIKADQLAGSAKAKGQAAFDAMKAKGQAAGEFARDKGQAAGAFARGKGQAAMNYAKAHPGKAGLIGAGLAAAGAGVAYGVNQYNQNKTAGYEDPMEELYMAKQAAEELYNDCLEKMAFAEQLFAEADYAEKCAADNGPGEPVPWINQLTTPVGATVAAVPTAAGAVAGALMNRARGPVGMAAGGVGGAILGAGVGAGALSALNTFSEQHRMARAQAAQGQPGVM